LLIIISVKLIPSISAYFPDSRLPKCKNCQVITDKTMSAPTTLTTSLVTPATRQILAQRDDGPLLGYYIDLNPSTSECRDQRPCSGITSLADFPLVVSLYCETTEVFTTSGRYGGCYGTDYVAATSTLNTGCRDVKDNVITTTGTQNAGIITWYETGEHLPSWNMIDNLLYSSINTVAWTCITQTGFQTYPDITPFTNYLCGGAYSAFTIYRDIPSTTSSSRDCPKISTVDEYHTSTDICR
jgi:hypothetical protein